MNIYNITKDDLENFLVQNGYKTFTARQVFDWLYKKRVDSFFKMHNIGLKKIELLKENFEITKLKILTRTKGKDVYKYLFELSDGNKIESVLMHHDYGYSICLSTQVGCNMGCKFCESGRLRKVRNLETFEILLPILMVEEDLQIHISRVVLMGIGEPFDNYDNVMRFIDIINDPYGLAIGSRHITVSTCGIIPKIKEFTEFDKQVNLAISLHAPNDKLRSSIMKINNVYKIADLMSVLKDYVKKTNRRLTFEYILIDGINDSKECALELAKLIQGMNAYVNLIPYNETSIPEFKKSSQKQVKMFYDILKKNHISVTIRREFGGLVNAACGQLRANYEEGI